MMEEPSSGAVRGVGLLAVLAVLAVGAPLALDDDAAVRAAPRPTGVTLVASDDDVGEFVTECPFSHRSTADPIVHPHVGAHDAHAGHSHDFFGNTTTDEHSTVSSLVGQPSTCQLDGDRSAYWAPTLFRGDEPITAEQFSAYYEAAPGADALALTPPPHGLRMIGGDPMLRRADPTAGLTWECGRSRDEHAAAPDCPRPAALTATIRFPDCWDGRRLDSPDHRAHVRASDAGHCPPTHPVPMVRLVLRIRYPHTGSVGELRFSSGPLHSGHADFMNAWDQEAIGGMVDLCIARLAVCGVV